ncbi:MAG: aspartate--ammonia ligase [Eubacteriales bacterium]|nr:aspartate--ammonia ligase [Eubacteriales bacterium]
MNSVYFPEGYKPALPIYETQRAIEFIKNTFQKELGKALNLHRVSAPLFVTESSGLNDNLNGVERPVSFDIPAADAEGQVVHSLAKWKRFALAKYNFEVGEGLYTNMNAIRRDESLDNIHSVYVDQWDWEKVITNEQRNVEYLKETVRQIVGVICDTAAVLKERFPSVESDLERNVTFVTTQELEDMYPDLTSRERENKFTEKYKTVFIMQIGDILKSGKKHDGRAPDYDDWSLNGDIMFWNKTLGIAFEVSSMGIRVDKSALISQLEKANCEDRKALPFHSMLLEDKLPLTMGGGIGQSRLCMLLMGNAHIGEVQSSIWDAGTEEAANKAGVILL